MYSDINKIEKSIEIDFSEAMDMILMVEELLDGEASELLSAKAFQGMSATLKVARGILRSSKENTHQNREETVIELKDQEFPKINKLGTQSLNHENSNKKTYEKDLKKKEVKKNTSKKTGKLIKSEKREQQIVKGSTPKRAPKIHMTRKALRTGLL